MYKPTTVGNPAKSETTRHRAAAPIASPTGAEDQAHADSSPIKFGTTIHFLAGVGFEAIHSQFSVPSTSRA